MPRAAKSKSTPGPVAGPSTPNTSPRKAPRARKAPAKPPPPTEADKAQWRQSRIDPGTTINKTDATKRYHLNEKDIAGLKFRTTEVVVRDMKRPMYLYQEREVEWRAWERYGSPELFDEMLNKKRAKYREKHGPNPVKPFPEPSSYEPSVRIMAFTPAQIRDAEARKYDASTPRLLDMKNQLKSEGKEWLWKAIIDAYNRSIFDDEFNVMAPGKRQEEETILPALDTLAPKYPPEARYPEDPAMSSSPSFEALRQVLVDAPVWTEDKMKSAINGQKVEGFEVIDFSYPEPDIEVDWEPEYFNRVYDALSAVITEHGAKGWRQARWLVYDKYSECNLGRIGFSRDEWYAGATKWLHAEDYDKMNEEKKAAFLASLRQRGRRH